MVRIDGRYGYIDRTGRLAIPAEWEGARSFAEKDPAAELAFVRKGGKASFIDRHGTIVIPINCWDAFGGFDESGLAVVMKEDADGLKQGFIDRVGKVVVPVEYRFLDMEKAAGTSIFRAQGYSDRLSDDRWERRIGLEWFLSAVGHPLPPRQILCKLRDLDGNVVWSSDWLSERSQIVLAGILIGLVALAEIGWVCLRQGAGRMIELLPASPSSRNTDSPGSPHHAQRPELPRQREADVLLADDPALG